MIRPLPPGWTRPGKDDRLDRMMADPETYFAEARARARQVVERDIERERELARRVPAGSWRAWFRRALDGDRG